MKWIFVSITALIVALVGVIITPRFSVTSNRSISVRNLSKLKTIWIEGLQCDEITRKVMDERLAFQENAGQLILDCLKESKIEWENLAFRDKAGAIHDWLLVGRVASNKNERKPAPLAISPQVLTEDGNRYWLLLTDDGVARLLRE
jgi:hypothetical protein